MDEYNDPTMDEDDEQWEECQNVAAAFKHYRTHSLQRINKRSEFILSLPEAHQRRLSGYGGYLARFRACIEVNDALLNLVVKDATNIFRNRRPAAPPRNGYGNGALSGERQPRLQVNEVQITLRQFVRDWSREGAVEREQCYKPILDEIRRQFPPDRCAASEVRVLVPGAGLGRLAYEIALLGYTCQGNEISMCMLIASNFVFNFCVEKERHVFYPWLTNFDNNMSCEDQLVAVRMPDALFSELPHPKQFSMIAGDFPMVYTDHNSWDCVATCFFIDCAPNVIVFIENIFNILRPGGVWINLGPLLYHFSDRPDVNSIEPPYDILMDIIKDIGFIVEKEQTCVKTKYATNPKSMSQQEYRSVFFVCRKPLTAVTRSPPGTVHAPFRPLHVPFASEPF